MTLPEKVPFRPGYELTINRIFNQMIAQYPDSEIVYRDKLRYTYKEFGERVEKIAAALDALGVKHLDRVATLDWNTHWHYELYMAVPMMSAVIHPVNIRLAPKEIAYVMNHAEDKIVVVHTDFTKLVQLLGEELKTVERYIFVGEDGHPDSIAGKPAHNYEDLLKEYGGKFEWPTVDENQVAGMGYTSGTTGLPKGVYHTHRQQVLHALMGLLHVSTAPRVNLSKGDVFMHIVPMFHVWSWGLPYAVPMIGLKQVFPGKLDPVMMLELITKEKVTYAAGVPTILYMLLTAPGAEKYDLTGFKFVVGGGALPKGLAKLALSRGIDVISGYGMTETAPILTIVHLPKEQLDPEKELELRTRTGIPIPLVDLIVADEDCKPVPKDGKTMGEILVRTPWVAYEYYKDPERTERAWRCGWFHTGDIAVWYTDGFVKIVDRDKDVIKSGGEWISSLRLEDIISRHPGVGQVAVIAAKHEKWGERPIALIVPKPGSTVTPDDIMGVLTKAVEAGEIPKWWLPDKILIVDELPLTSVGKVNKRVLRDKYSNILLE
ncbi:MAG: long-chain fatty acid--CoA ligase [Desulfurococcales archaeon]|nr:long-chain fatty acid--CoA ligase [Desulfurococcales archaeon]